MALPPGTCYSRLSLSPNGLLLAASHGSTLDVIDAKTGDLLERIKSANGENAIAGLVFAPLETGESLLATFAGQCVRFWSLKK